PAPTRPSTAPSHRVCHILLTTRGDPLKRLGIAALPVLTYQPVRSAPVLANPASFQGLNAGSSHSVLNDEAPTPASATHPLRSRQPTTTSRASPDASQPPLHEPAPRANDHE